MYKTIVTKGHRRLERIVIMIAMVAIIMIISIFSQNKQVGVDAEMACTTSGCTISTITDSAEILSFIATGSVLNVTESAIVTEVETAPAVVASTPAVEATVGPRFEGTKEPKTTKKSKKGKKSTDKKSKKKEFITLKEYIKGMSLDMRVDRPSGLSKKEFIKLLSGLRAKVLKKRPDIPPDPKGLYKKEAAFIWELGQEYQVDEIFLTALTGQEGGWFGYDLALKRNNFTGQMLILGDTKKLRTYKSVRENLEDTARNLRNRYLKTLKTLEEINCLYCEPNKKGEYTWFTEVYRCMKTIVRE